MPEETFVPASTETYYSPEVDNRWPELSPKPMDKRPIIYGVIAAVVVILIFVGIGVGLFLNPSVAAVLRDILLSFWG